MNTANLPKRALHFSLIVLSILLVSACSGLGQDKKTAPVLFTDFSNTAEYLLKQAEALDETKNTEWQLAAVQALNKENKFVLANSVIEYLQNKTLNTQQKNHLLLLIADNQYAQNQLDSTLVSINKINIGVLSPEAKLHYLKLKADLQVRNKEHQQAANTLLMLTPLLQIDEEKQQYNDLLLTQLSLLPASVLNKYQQTATPYPLATESTEATDSSATVVDVKNIALLEKEMFVGGWYALASVYQRYQLSNNRLLRAVDAWKLVYSNHPALDFMPTQLTSIPEATPYQANKIAVLLPLSGRFKQPAEAIQYGISNAFYNQMALKKQSENEQNKLNSTNSMATTPEIVIVDELQKTPADIMFIDTTQMTAQAIADKLHLQKIDFVIGPLVKSNVDQLLPLIEDIPVLALNRFPTPEETTSQGSSIHYAFPLSPESEAEQAAERIFNNKHKKPLILAPQSNFGERVSKAFEARWKVLNQAEQEKSDNTLEHYPAETHFFTKKSEFAKFVASALQTDKSQQRINQMRSAISLTLEAELRSRRDVDAIYIIGDRGELILLKPFIAVTISPFANSIALYASSRSHAIDMSNIQNKELSNLTFSDIAFLLDDKGQINQKLQATWPHQSFSTLRLFALGYDSYNLIGQLKQLQVIEGYKYQGLVGELSLDETNTIGSKLHWATYKEGSLVEVTSSVPGQ